MMIDIVGGASRAIHGILIHLWQLSCPLIDLVKISTLLHNVEIWHVALHLGNPDHTHYFEVCMTHYCLSEILETMVLINTLGYLLDW